MANLKETATWEAGIYQFETSDPVMGGENGIDNKPTRQLANRTSWLKTELAKAVQSIGTNLQTAEQKYALKTTTLTAGAGLVGGGVLRDNMTLSLGTPSKITATTTNSAVSNTHTHEIDKASVTVMGIVKLSSATNSDAENIAATPKAIKTVLDALTNLDGRSFKQYGALSSRNLNDLKGDANYGVWHQTANAAATAERNYPTTKAGTLYVLPSAYQGQQIYYPLDQNVFYKRHSLPDGSWSAWHTMCEIIDSSSSTSTTAAASANQVKRLNDRAANIENTKFDKAGGTVTGHIAAQYLSDWVSFAARNPTEGKHGCYDVHVGGYNRGGFAILGVGNGEYRAQIRVTAPGEVAQDRRTVGMEIRHNEIATQAYGKLHDAFVRITGNIAQTITGDKTFAGITTATTALRVRRAINSAFPHFQIIDDSVNLAETITTNKYIGEIQFRVHETGQQTGRLKGLWRTVLQTDKNVITDFCTFNATNVEQRHLRLFSKTGNTQIGHANDNGRDRLQVEGTVQATAPTADANNDQVPTTAWVRGYAPSKSDLNNAAPSGEIAFFARNAAPAGWLKANGAAVSRTTYATLFAAIGTTFGAGDGSTTFNLPDLRGEFLRGWDDGRGVDVGRAFGSHQSDAFQGHARNLKRSQSDARMHGLNYYQNVEINNNQHSPAPAVINNGDTWLTHDYLPHLSYGTPRVAAETRPRNIALLACIKI